MKFISPSRMIQIAIANAISSTFSSAFEISLSPNEISLNICYPKYGAHYTSAIALAIANRLNLSPVQIASAIAKTSSQNPEISSQWQIQVLGKGWLNIFLSEKYLVESLFALENLPIAGFANCEGFWQKRDISIDSVNKSTDPIMQYAYARCCALIRLARDNLTIHELSNYLPDRFGICLEPIEISLLMQNFAIADYLESLESENSIDRHKSRTKLSRSLAEAFLQFYDRCRIFGVPQEIAVKRLLLIRITQKLLIAIAPPEIDYAMYL
jgi:arginyl-tRNA synthetase